jgi:glycine cleavage system H protein
MSDIPSELKYTAEHEWIRIEGNEITVGITDFAQNALTDVVWVELPEINANVNSMESYGSVESVKSVSEIYAPISGTVTQINEWLDL